MKIYDITAAIGDNMPVYGNERPTVNRVAKIEEGAPYNFTTLAFTTHTGTHADMPAHFVLDGATCDTVPLTYFYGKAKVIRVPVTSHVTRADLLPHDIQAGDILLIDTGQSKYMGQGAFKQDFIALTPDAAAYLVEKQVKTVGIDYLSIDPYGAEGFPAHKLLLGSGVAVLEGLVLENVPEGEYILSALPLKIAGGDGSPVRAVLVGE